MPSASQCIVAPRSFCVLAICALTICPAHWLYCVGLSLAARRKQSLGRKQPTGPLVVAAMPVSSSMKSRLRNGKFIQSVRSRRRSWTDFGRLADHVPPWVTGGTEGEEDDAGTGSVEASDPLGELEAMHTSLRQQFEAREREREAEVLDEDNRVPLEALFDVGASLLRLRGGHRATKTTAYERVTRRGDDSSSPEPPWQPGDARRGATYEGACRLPCQFCDLYYSESFIDDDDRHRCLRYRNHPRAIWHICARCQVMRSTRRDRSRSPIRHHPDDPPPEENPDEERRARRHRRMRSLADCILERYERDQGWRPRMGDQGWVRRVLPRSDPEDTVSIAAEEAVAEARREFNTRRLRAMADRLLQRLESHQQSQPPNEAETTEEDNTGDSTVGMQILVKTVTGKTVTISTTSNATIGELKRAIEYKMGIPWTAFRLLFGGRQLDDDKTVGYYNIERGSTVHLVLFLRGGARTNGFQTDGNEPTTMSGSSSQSSYGMPSESERKLPPPRLFLPPPRPDIWFSMVGINAIAQAMSVFRPKVKIRLAELLGLEEKVEFAVNEKHAEDVKQENGKATIINGKMEDVADMVYENEKVFVVSEKLKEDKFREGSDNEIVTINDEINGMDFDQWSWKRSSRTTVSCHEKHEEDAKQVNGKFAIINEKISKKTSTWLSQKPRTRR